MLLLSADALFTASFCRRAYVSIRRRSLRSSVHPFVRVDEQANPGLGPILILISKDRRCSRQHSSLLPSHQALLPVQIPAQLLLSLNPPHHQLVLDPAPRADHAYDDRPDAVVPERAHVVRVERDDVDPDLRVEALGERWRQSHPSHVAAGLYGLPAEDADA